MSRFGGLYGQSDDEIASEESSIHLPNEKRGKVNSVMRTGGLIEGQVQQRVALDVDRQMARPLMRFGSPKPMPTE